jgi:hypothetical protein
MILRLGGAPSVTEGVTPHLVRDELCRAR